MAQELIRQGWEVLGRNVRHVGYELDLVARKGETLAVVEVKARRQPQLDLAELLPPRKREALRRGAEGFLTARAIEAATIRFDLAVVRINAAGKALAIDYHVDVMAE